MPAKKKRKKTKKRKNLFNPPELRKEIRNQMRRVFWYYFRPAALKYYQQRDDNGFFWVCNFEHCRAIIRQEKNAKVDHIDPVRDTELSEQSWDLYFERLFVPPEKTQILCGICHAQKTVDENSRRV